MIIDMNRLTGKYLVVAPKDIKYENDDDIPRIIGPIKNINLLENNKIKFNIGDENYTLSYQLDIDKNNNVERVLYITKYMPQAILFVFEKFGGNVI